MLEKVKNASAVQAKVDAGGELVLGFFGDFSAASKKAQPEFERFAQKHEGMQALLVDVAKVKGVHKQFGVANVPTVIRLKDKEVMQLVVGPQTADGYERALEAGTMAFSADGEESKKQPRVVVYTTPTCTFCGQVKTYLRKNGVRFSEIDVAADESAARSMMSRSGQAGVPQLDIGGTIVVGFDKKKINDRLGIHP